MSTIVKATSKGQITLPAKWRKELETDHFILEIKSGKIVITPLDIEKAKGEQWDTVFDALRDNNGKGVAVGKMLKALQEIEDEDE